MLCSQTSVWQLSDCYAPTGDAVLRVGIGIESEIDTGIFRKTLVLTIKGVNEQLSIVVSAVGHVEKEVPITWQKYTSQCLRTKIRALEPLAFCQGQVRPGSYFELFEISCLIDH